VLAVVQLAASDVDDRPTTTFCAVSVHLHSSAVFKVYFWWCIFSGYSFTHESVGFVWVCIVGITGC